VVACIGRIVIVKSHHPADTYNVDVYGNEFIRKRKKEKEAEHWKDSLLSDTMQHSDANNCIIARNCLIRTDNKVTHLRPRHPGHAGKLQLRRLSA
jgi:hypothetical protein